MPQKAPGDELVKAFGNATTPAGVVRHGLLGRILSARIVQPCIAKAIAGPP